MSNAAHAYTPPETTGSTVLPAQVARYLDGNDLLAKTQALRISTIDADKAGRMPLSSAPAICWRCHRDEFAWSSSLNRQRPRI